MTLCNCGRQISSEPRDEDVIKGVCKFCRLQAIKDRVAVRRNARDADKEYERIAHFITEECAEAIIEADL
jgi:hypothetical protein